MDAWDSSRYALSSCAAVALLVGCGGAQPPIGAPGIIPDANALTMKARSSYHLLYSFEGNGNGANPVGGLTLVNGKLYGVTDSPCLSSCSPKQAGVEFYVTPSGKEKVLYTGFQGLPNAVGLNGPLTYLRGSFYDTSQLGGTRDDGTVFELTTSGSEKVLYNFQGGKDGALPQAGLLAFHGLLYGTTISGGLSSTACLNGGCGTIFSVTTSGTKKVLYRFKGFPHDGSDPVNNQLVAVKGVLYGVTWLGGNGGCYEGCGTIFSVSTSGTERVLYNFQGAPDGENPGGTLVLLNGLLYGTTVGGGTSEACPGGCGTFFSASRSGNVHVLYSFKGGRQVAGPASLIVANGSFFGTAPSFCGYCGTAYEISATGRERLLHRFAGGSSGLYPEGFPLALEKGKMYGITAAGGQYNLGTVFTLSP